MVEAKKTPVKKTEEKKKGVGVVTIELLAEDVKTVEITKPTELGTVFRQAALSVEQITTDRYRVEVNGKVVTNLKSKVKPGDRVRLIPKVSLGAVVESPLKRGDSPSDLGLSDLKIAIKEEHYAVQGYYHTYFSGVYPGRRLKYKVVTERMVGLPLNIIEEVPDSGLVVVEVSHTSLKSLYRVGFVFYTLDGVDLESVVRFHNVYRNVIEAFAEVCYAVPVWVHIGNGAHWTWERRLLSGRKGLLIEPGIHLFFGYSPNLDFLVDLPFVEGVPEGLCKASSVALATRQYKGITIEEIELGERQQSLRYCHNRKRRWPNREFYDGGCPKGPYGWVDFKRLFYLYVGPWSVFFVGNFMGGEFEQDENYKWFLSGLMRKIPWEGFIGREHPKTEVVINKLFLLKHSFEGSALWLFYNYIFKGRRVDAVNVFQGESSKESLELLKSNFQTVVGGGAYWLEGSEMRSQLNTLDGKISSLQEELYDLYRQRSKVRFCLEGMRRLMEDDGGRALREVKALIDSCDAFMFIYEDKKFVGGVALSKDTVIRFGGKDWNFGRYLVFLSKEQSFFASSEPPDITMHSEDGLRLAGGGNKDGRGCVHPHISYKGESCLGDGYEQIMEFCAEGYFVKALVYAVNMLKFYNSDDCYRGIDNFARVVKRGKND